MEDKQFYVYMTTNYSNSSIYTGMTNDLIRRIYEHKSGFKKSFSGKYKVDRLVYYEIFDTPYDAIVREKQIKGWTRIKKKNLINSLCVSRGLDFDK